MGCELFLDFFSEHEVPVIRKRRHTFLKMEDENVYVLKEGVVKVSVLMRDGREFNITYLKGFDILSMFKDAVVDCKFSSLMIRVESDEASFYCVSKELFNQLESAEAETIRLDSLVEENPEDEALEEAWDTAYKKEYDIKMLLANHIVTFTSGKIDLKTAHTMIMSRREQLKTLILKIA